MDVGIELMLGVGSIVCGKCVLVRKCRYSCRFIFLHDMTENLSVLFDFLAKVKQMQFNYVPQNHDSQTIIYATFYKKMLEKIQKELQKNSEEFIKNCIEE